MFSGPVASALAAVTDPASVVYSRSSQVTVEEPWHVGRGGAGGRRARSRSDGLRPGGRPTGPQGRTAIPSISTSACSSQSLATPMTAIAG